MVSECLAGNLLIAPPAITQNFWSKTVVLVTEHYQKGSVGVILNKRSSVTLKEFGNQLGYKITASGFVYIGGPVGTKNLLLLHTNDWTSSNTLRINDGISLSSDATILPRLAIKDFPTKWRLFLGMCQWGENQLEQEIYGPFPKNYNTGWCIASSDTELMFKYDLDQQWAKSLDRAGLEFSQRILD